MAMKLIKGNKHTVDVLQIKKLGIKLEAWKYHDCAMLEFNGKQWTLTPKEAKRLGNFIAKLPKK